ncbi:MAG: phosphonate ABC transporter substrate-binding protein [Desulfobacterales bacterium]|jgi:phosphonate transport system substrate-binding protein
MLKRIQTMMALLVATLVLIGPAAAAEDVLNPPELSFGIISTESTSELKKNWMPFLQDMSAALSMPVKPFFASDYAGVIEGMRFKKVHVAWFGNKSAIEAVDRANGEVFAQQVDVDGNPGYWSLIITHKDTGLESMDDVIKRGKTLDFGNGDVNSTSGYLIPSYYLWTVEYGIDPKQHFKTVRNANHSANLMAVAMKQVDFATNNTERIKKFKKQNPELAQNIKILWKSPLIPSDPLVWRKDLDRELKSKIKGFVLAYGRSGDNKAHALKVLAGLDLAPYWDSSNKQLIPIREIKYAKEKMKVAHDENISTAAKQEKLKAIDAKIAEVRQFSDMMDRY